MTLMMVRLQARAAVAFAEQKIVPWGGFTPQGVIPPFDYKAFLRRLLLELREPSQEMIDAGNATDGLPVAYAVWRAMIDEVLND